MIKRSDFWLAFLIGVHLVLLQRLISIGQTLIITNTLRASGVSSLILGIKMVISVSLVGLFFNSLYKVLSLLNSSEKNFEKVLSKCLLALIWLISLMFVVSILPKV